MDNATYVGLSKQILLQRELDIVANNLANVDTTGFKVESLISGADPTLPAHTLGVTQPVQFSVDNGLARDFTQAIQLQPAMAAAHKWASPRTAMPAPRLTSGPFARSKPACTAAANPNTTSAAVATSRSAFGSASTNTSDRTGSSPTSQTRSSKSYAWNACSAAW